MNVYDASEVAYRNGYEAGKRDAIDRLAARITERRDTTLGLERAVLNDVLELIQEAEAAPNG